MADETTDLSGPLEGQENPSLPETPQRGIDGSDISRPSPRAQGAQPAAPAAQNADPEYLRHRREGETPDQTYRRLWEENRDRGAKEYHQRKALEEQVARLNGLVEPLLAEQYQRIQAEQLRAQQAAIPDRETNPEGYRVWLAEQQYLMQVGQLQQTAEERAEAERLQGMINLDAPIDQQILEIQSGAEPQVKADFEHLITGSMQAARMDFPDATDEQIEELVVGAMRLTARNWAMRGISIKDGIAHRMGVLRAMAGIPQPAPGQQQQPRQGQPSRTAAALQQQSGRARKAAALSAPVPGSPGGLPTQGTDWATLTEADYIQAAMAGQFDPFEYAAKRFGKQQAMYEDG